MKKQILGFMNIAQLVDNNPAQLSELGELSTWSMTYSKTHGYYTSDITPGYLLTTFSVKDTVTETDQPLVLAEYQLILRIAQSCIAYASMHTAPLDPVDFHASIQAEYFNEITDLEFGDLVSASNTTLPAWMAFNTKTGDKNENRVWFADASFQLEYPEYDITVVSPLPDRNDYLKPWATAVALLDQRGMTVLTEEMQAEKKLHPETYVRMFEFDFVNRTNPTQKKKTYWYVLVYGEAGNNDDAIKDAIIEDLVSSTGQPEDVWEPIFPELFKRTETVILPRWDQISVPNMSTLTGLYSSYMGLEDNIVYAQDKIEFYPDDWIRANSMSWPVTYKALSVVSIDGMNNIEGKEKLRLLYPDYIPVPTTDPDFQRMSEATKAWVHFLLRLVIAAEKVTATSGLPQGIRRLKRGNIWYVVGTHTGVNYLVSQRRNFVTG